MIRASESTICALKADVRTYINLEAAASSAGPLIPAITIITNFIEKPFPINEQSRQSGKHQDRVIGAVVFPENAMRSFSQICIKRPRGQPWCKFVETRTKNDIFPEGPKFSSCFMNITSVNFTVRSINLPAPRVVSTI